MDNYGQIITFESYEIIIPIEVATFLWIFQVPPQNVSIDNNPALNYIIYT